MGLLPIAKGMGSIRARQSSGPFKTSGTEKWPAKMCQWIAAVLLATCTSPATSAAKGIPEVQTLATGTGSDLDKAFWTGELEKEAFRMAAGGLRATAKW